MNNIRGLSDLQGKKDDEKKTESYTGGERSGLAVENPTGDGLHASFPDVVRSSEPLPPNRQKVTVYKNGFRIDDGEFRSLDEPENKKFIANLKAGFAPPELQKGASQGSVHVAFEDRSTETYELPPPPKYTLFQGTGQSLSTSSTSAAAKEPVDTSRGAVNVNDSAPTTDIQFRFHNGTRNRQRFNETHTIADIHSYLSACAPVNGQYIIMTGFPPRELTLPPSTTLKEAGLLNETITQKLK